MMVFMIGVPFSLFMSIKSFFFFNLVMILPDYCFCLLGITFLLLCLLFFSKSFFFEVSTKTIFIFGIFTCFFFMNLLFFCVNSFWFIFFFEVSLIPMILLIFNFGKDVDKISSSIFMMMMNIFGSLPFMIFVWLFYSFCYSVNELIYVISWVSMVKNVFLFLLCNLVFIFKLPFIFFHFWLTKAHVSASGACSMILASLMLKLGSLGLLKYSKIFFLIYLNIFFFFFFFFFISLIFLPFFMFRFFDFKYMVALSSIIHMCMLPLLIYLFLFSGFFSSIFMIMGHGLVSALLFFLVSLGYEIFSNRSMEFLKSLESFSKLFFFFVVLFLFLNFGLPPFINFFSEFYCFFCLFNFDYLFLVFMLISGILVNLVCMYICTKFVMGKKVIICFLSLSDIIVFFFIYCLLFFSLMVFFY